MSKKCGRHLWGDGLEGSVIVFYKLATAATVTAVVGEGVDLQTHLSAMGALGAKGVHNGTDDKWEHQNGSPDGVWAHEVR